MHTHRERPRGEAARVGALLLGRLGHDDLQRVDAARDEAVDAEALWVWVWVWMLMSEGQRS